MKNTVVTAFVIIVAFFLVLAGYVSLAGPIPFSVNSVTTTKQDTFTVTGTGKVPTKPDTAYVRVGVTANGSTVRQAQDQLNKTISQISAAIKKLGVDAADIQTENYNINPNYDYRVGTQQITGYTANTNLAIKVRNLDRANDVIDAATQNGATQVGGITFDVADKDRAENMARQKAVADGKKKAQDAARIAGFSLGRIINYSENFGGGVPVPLRMDLQAAPAVEKAVPTQVEPGSQEIQVTVNLSYEIR